GMEVPSVEFPPTLQRDVAAECLDGVGWEGLVGALGFLQAGNVRLAFLKPGEDTLEPLFDRIDVPRRYSHSAFFPVGRIKISRCVRVPLLRVGRATPR